MSFQQVSIHHGLCTTFHGMEHKPQYVRGLGDHLQRLGYRVDYREAPFVNYCMIEMSGHEVFRCNLRNLSFSTHISRDNVAQRAITAIVAATVKLKIARQYMWTRNLIKENMFTRGPYAPREYWPVEEEIKPYVSCNKCVACCDISVSKKTFRTLTTSKCYEFNVSSQLDLSRRSTSLHVQSLNKEI